MKKIAKKFLIFNELWQIFLVIRYLRLEKSVAWQSVVQQSIQKDAPTNAPKIAQWLCEKYPKVFEYSACGICDSMNSKPAHLGAVFLENKLTPYSPGVPFYARFCFPLIYSECQECGAARINPRPVRSWIDHVEPDLPPPSPPYVPPFEAPSQAGQMEETSYIEDKQRSISIHHEKMDLAQFQSEHARVLDISCGSGVGLETLKNKFHWKGGVGVECDPQSVHLAREKRKLEVHYGLINGIEFPSHSFDLVVMDNSLEHHWSPHEVLLKVKTLLREGGGFCIMVPNYHGYAVEHFGVNYQNMNWGHWHYYTVQSLQNLLRKAGFQLIKAYSSVCESVVLEKFGGKQPSKIHVELEGEDLAKLSFHDKVFRGDFIHLLAISQDTDP